MNIITPKSFVVNIFLPCKPIIHNKAMVLLNNSHLWLGTSAANHAQNSKYSGAFCLAENFFMPISMSELIEDCSLPGESGECYIALTSSVCVEAKRSLLGE